MERQRKLMLLGGLHYLIPVIDKAHEMGHYVITCDYLPDNAAHRHSDCYVNVNITDQEAVLREAQRLQIDGIMSFAVDPGVVTAAYVQEAMGLPSIGPYPSVVTMQRKDLFRQFLANHDFNVPKAKGYASVDEAMADLPQWTLPIIVKPVDSAGSKGVSRIDEPQQAQTAFVNAMQMARCGRIIVEEFLDVEMRSSSDAIIQDGRVTHSTYTHEYNEANISELTPIGEVMPPDMHPSQIATLDAELQRLVTLLGLRNTIINIDSCVTRDGKAYLMEVAPRGGGARIAELVSLATDEDLVSMSIHLAMGDDVPLITQKAYNGHWAMNIIHATDDGPFKELKIKAPFDERVVMLDLWKKPGDAISRFNSSTTYIGIAFFRFADEDERRQYCQDSSGIIRVIVE